MKTLTLSKKTENIIIDSNGKIFIDNFDGENDIHIDIKNKCDALLSVLSLDKFIGEININIDNGCRLEVYYADFAKNNSKCQVNIALNEGASVIFHLASLTSGNAEKKFTICVMHNEKNTYSFVDNYGVVKEKGKLIFDGVSHIKNGSIKSNTRQNAKIMVFDKNSVGIAKPILKIDENDIQASHGAVVGKISDDHLFYLMSRGISEEKSKTLITYGYLKPIMIGFDDGIKEKIEELIEGGM